MESNHLLAIYSLSLFMMVLEALTKPCSSLHFLLLFFLLKIVSSFHRFNLATFHFFEGPTPEPPPPKPCKEHLDVGVVIDSSNSISQGDYNIARQYIVQLARRLEISEAGTHMAILLYSFEAHTWHRLVKRLNCKVGPSTSAVFIKVVSYSTDIYCLTPN